MLLHAFKAFFGSKTTFISIMARTLLNRRRTSVHETNSWLDPTREQIMTKRSYHAIPAKALLLGAAILSTLSPMTHAQESTPAPATTEVVATAPEVTAPEAATPAPTVEERLADLEASHNNGAPTALLKDTASPAHNGFMMICAVLVLFMTLPGLALFYGGLVRSKNILSICAQCCGIAGMVAILWWAVGYSLVFGTNFDSPYLGGSEFFFLKGVDLKPNTNYAYWISQSVFCMYEDN